MKLQTQIKQTTIEPSSVGSVSANIAIDANIGDITIDEIAGNISLRSKLEKGRLKLVFSPHFAYGVSLTSQLHAVDDQIAQKFKEVGFSDEQINTIGKVLGEEALDFEFGEISESNLDLPNNSSQISLKTNLLEEQISIPLPDIPLNFDPSINVRNFRIENIRLSENTSISAGNLNTQPSILNDFFFETDTPEAIEFSSIEVNDAHIRPISIPDFSLPDFTSELNIPRIGASEMPLEVESPSGSSDISLPLLAWHPRWRSEICIRILGVRKCAWIEYGINLDILLEYEWLLSLLHVSLKLRNAFINTIKISVKLSQIAIKAVQIGLLKIQKFLTLRQ